MEFIDCPCTGKTLARLVRPAILTLLAAEPLHGYELLRRLAPMPLFHNQTPDAAGVYRVLREMEAEGLLAGGWDLAERGPAKRRFGLTDEGRACLARWVDTLARYQTAITGLLNEARLALGPQTGRKAS